MPAILELQSQFGFSIVFATTKRGVQSKEYASSLSCFDNRWAVDTVIPSLSSNVLQSQWQQFRGLRRFLRNERPDHIFVCVGDGQWQLIELSRRLGFRCFSSKTTAETWIYRGAFAYPLAKGLRSRFLGSLFAGSIRAATFSVMHLDDEILYKEAINISGRRTILDLSPNPVKANPLMDKTSARRAIHLRVDGKLIGTFGMIDRRKGSDLLCKAFLKVAELDSSISLVLGGPHSDEIKKLLSTPAFLSLKKQGRLHSLDRFFNEDEMFCGSSACDLVVAPYPNHSGRSSIVLWAAVAGRPSLATNRGCLQYVVEKERLGFTCDVLDSSKFALSLIAAVRHGWTEIDQQRWRTYGLSHSIERYRESATEFLRGKLDKLNK